MSDIVPVSGLRRLWQQAFGDTEEFLDLFFDRAFSPQRCLWCEDDGQVTAALYWLDCSYRGQKTAYVYAVATDRDHRGRGLCRSLMERLHGLLRSWGYAGAVLVPGAPELAGLYEKLGYRFSGGSREAEYLAGAEPVSVKPISRDAYQILRRKYLPPDSVIQEGENLELLDALGAFYALEKGCLWISQGPDGSAAGELLGDPSLAPGILRTLGMDRGRFWGPGNTPFAMFLPLDDLPGPAYLGFAFD